MPKYIVVGLVDSTVSEEIEAASPKDAMDKAGLSASVCHQCAKELEVGDVYDVQVLDEEGVLLVEFSQDRDAARMKNALLDVVKFAEARNMVALKRLAKKGLG